MNAAVRPLHLLGEHALRSIGEHASQALDAWCREWLRDAAPMPVTAQALQRHALPSGEFTEVAGSLGRLWIRTADDERNALARAVLGEEFLPLATAADAWSRDALAQAREQRDRCLAQALVGDIHATTARAPDAAVFAPASGAVHLSCEALGLHIVADSGVLAHVPPRAHAAAQQPSPAPLLQAAAAAQVAVTVDLGSVELDLAHLLDLQPGDVICLPARLSEPVPVLLHGQAVARGYLGHCNKRKAVQLESL